MNNPCQIQAAAVPEWQGYAMNDENFKKENLGKQTTFDQENHRHRNYRTCNHKIENVNLVNRNPTCWEGLRQILL